MVVLLPVVLVLPVVLPSGWGRGQLPHSGLRRLNQIKAIEPYAHVQFLDLSHNVIPPKDFA